jgi:radical SAM superfamily enzyme YgiQ (UPF0313 family)
MTAVAAPALTEEAMPLPPLGSGLKVLMVWPRFAPSFWSLAGMMAMVPQKALQPPLGLLTIAALCPVDWKLRLIDCSVEDLGDADILWADLVMVSGMRLQHEGIADVLARARALGRRTIIGGPHASAEPELLLPLADHVVVGEPDEVFAGIAADLEHGTAKRLYVIEIKPDITKSPLPRYDLLKIDQYLLMSVQFSRGCPFQCEFCDIITIYEYARVVTADLEEELHALPAEVPPRGPYPSPISSRGGARKMVKVPASPVLYSQTPSDSRRN